MSEESYKLITAAKRKAKRKHQSFKNGDIASAKYLITNHPHFENHDPSDLLKENIQLNIFQHAVAKEKGFYNWFELRNNIVESNLDCEEKKWIEYYELKKPPYPRGVDPTTFTFNPDVDIRDIVSLIQGKDIYSSLITFTNGNVVCAKGSPNMLVSYLCDKDISNFDTDFDPSKFHTFIIDNRIYGQNIHPNVNDEYKIPCYIEKETLADYKRRVYTQFKQYGYIWIKDTK